MRTRVLRRWLWAVFAPACLLLPHSASAICNAIPGATGIFRGAVGSLNRPFASPGDFVGVEVNRAICDAGSPGIPSEPLSGPIPLVVTVLFVPPDLGSGLANAVLVAEDCNQVTSRVAECDGASMAAPCVSGRT